MAYEPEGESWMVRTTFPQQTKDGRRPAVPGRFSVVGCQVM